MTPAAPSNIILSDIDHIEVTSDIWRNQFTFGFNLPHIYNLAGIELWQSYTSTGTYTKVDEQLLTSLSTSGGLFYYTYTTDTDSVDGRYMYYKLKDFTTTNSFSAFSATVEVATIPSRITGLQAWWDSEVAELEWDDIDTSTGKNVNVDNYAIARSTFTLLSGHTYSSNVLTNSNYVEGDYLLVLHTATETYWFGRITVSGVFTINANNMIRGGETTIVYDNFVAGDLVVYNSSRPDTSDIIGNSGLVTSYTDNTAGSNIRYFYGIITQDTINSRNSSAAPFHVVTKNLTSTIPKIRRFGNSSTDHLNKDSNAKWIAMKDSLVDEFFYDKAANAIPFTTEPVNLRGWIGVGRALVDVYQNEKFILTTTTGIYGDASFDVTWIKATTNSGEVTGEGLNTIRIETKNMLETISSTYTGQADYQVYNMYTIFAAAGSVLNDYDDEEDRVKTDNYISTARSDALEDNFGSIVSLNKLSGWTTAQYRAILQSIWNSYDYSAVKKGLRDIIGAFPEVEHVDIYQRLGNRPPYRVSYHYIGTPDLGLGDYYYGVSAYKDTGELTTPSEIRLDRRWWPVTYEGVNTLYWDGNTSANGYYIYRGNTSTGMTFMTSASGTVFFDDGSIVPDGTTEPLTLNYSGMEEPSGLSEQYPFLGRDLDWKRKSVHGLHIIIFGYSDSPISSEKQNNITTLIGKIIPTSLKPIITYTS